MLNYSCPSSAAKQQGFTLIEMMVSVAILAILATIAAPSFKGLIERWRVRTAAEELQGTLYLARSDAIRCSGNVTLSASGSGWSEGWSLAPTTPSTPDCVREQVVTTSAHTTVTLSTSKTTITADRWGVLRSDTSSDFTFTLYPSSAGDSSSAARLVCVSPSGRIRNVPKSAGCTS